MVEPGERMVQCRAEVGYNGESSRKMADGEPRYLKPNRCQRKASWRGTTFMGAPVNHPDLATAWCGQHARNLHVSSQYGPFERLSGSRGESI